MIYFNPRAPCGARRHYASEPPTGLFGFQPTRPLRGATARSMTPRNNTRDFNPRAPCGARHYRTAPTYNKQDFNPRAPCGARPGSSGAGAASEGISTHAPLAGRDGPQPTKITGFSIFQPTRPLRGATVRKMQARGKDGISTHAPLAGRDFDKVVRVFCALYFNPRAPCGARRTSGSLPKAL